MVRDEIEKQKPIKNPKQIKPFLKTKTTIERKNKWKEKFEFWLNQCESRGEKRERKREEIKISLPEDVAFSSHLFFY